MPRKNPLAYKRIFGNLTTGTFPSGFTRRLKPAGTTVITVDTTVPTGSEDTKSLKFALPTGGNANFIWDETTAPGGNITLQADVRFSVIGSDGNAGKVGIFARASLNGLYSAYIKPNGNLLRISKFTGVGSLSETIVQAKTITELTLTVDTWYTIKFELSGTTLRAKVWATGGTEPSTWLCDTTDSTYTAGESVGLWAYDGIEVCNSYVTNFKSIDTSSRIKPRFMGGSTLFNGSTSKIVIADNTIVPVTGVTLDCWVNQTTIGTALRVLNLHNSCSLNINNGSARFTLYGVWDGTSTYKLPTGKWVKLTATYDRVSAKVYVNGVLAATDAKTDAFPTGTIIPGIGHYNGASFFSGKIAEAKFYTQALTASQAAELYSTGSVSGVSPVADYALDDQPSTYIDSIGGNNGTGTATTYSTDVPVQQRMAVSNDTASLNFVSASSQYVRAATITPVPTLAVSAFARIYSLNFKQSFPGIISYGASNASFNWDLNLNNSNGKIQVDIQNSSASTTQPVGNTALEDNKWHTVGFTYNGTTVSIYIDGKLDKTSAFSSTALAAVASSAFNIGRLENGFYFNGKIENAQVWNTALTAAQIRDLHFNNIVPTDELVLNLKLNEGAGSTAYDSSGNGNNGTITGATWSSDTPSKARTVVGGNLVKNGDFSYVPVVNVATTANQRWVDGTSGGSTDVETGKLFRFAISTKVGSVAALFDTTNLSPLGHNSIKLSTTAVASLVESHPNRVDSDADRKASGQNGILYPCLPSTSYTASFYAKTNYVSGDATSGANLSFASVNGSGTVTNFHASPFVLVKTTTPWTLYSYSFTTSATARYISLYRNIYGQDGAATLIMDAWFADISLTKTTPTTRTTV